MNPVAETSSPHEVPMSSLIPKTSLFGAMISYLAAMDKDQFFAVVGLLITVAGFFINLYFQFRKDRRDAELHKAHIASVERK
jgi:hypothetical protein